MACKVMIETTRTIDGVPTTGLLDVTDLVRRSGQDSPFQDPSFDRERNTRPIFTIDLELEVEPEKLKKFYAYEQDGVTVQFGGLVQDAAPIETGPGTPIVWRTEIAGKGVYLDFKLWTKSYTTDQTLKQVLQDAIADKAAGDFILAAGQVDGPTITAPFGWAQPTRLSDVIRSLITDRLPTSPGWMYDMSDDPTPALELFEAGSRSAPSAVDEDAVSRFAATPDSDFPANAVVALIGTAGDAVTQRWTWHTGDPLAFVTDFPDAGDGYAFGFLVIINDGPTVNPATGRTDTISPPGQGGFFEWDAAAHTLTQVAGPGLVDGDTIDFQYRPAFPFQLTRTTGASPTIEAAVGPYPDVTSYPQAVTLLDNLLAVAVANPRTFDFDLLGHGFRPGQGATIDVPLRRAGSTAGVVSKVSGTWHTTEFWEYSIEAYETHDLPLDYVSEWRKARGASTSGAVAAAAPADVGAFGAYDALKTYASDGTPYAILIRRTDLGVAKDLAAWNDNGFFKIDSATKSFSWDGATGRLASDLLSLQAVTFANLPAAPVPGTMALVFDSPQDTWRAIVSTGGGSNTNLVIYLGGNWVVFAVQA